MKPSGRDFLKSMLGAGLLTATPGRLVTREGVTRRRVFLSTYRNG